MNFSLSFSVDVLLMLRLQFITSKTQVEYMVGLVIILIQVTRVFFFQTEVKGHWSGVFRPKFQLSEIF